MTLNDSDECSKPAIVTDNASQPDATACPADPAMSSSALLSTLRGRGNTSKSLHLQGISDLTLLAPFKPGLLPVLETRTYESRARSLMKSLHGLRVNSREYSALRPFVDMAASIRTILSFRLAIVDRKLLLAVTFDRPWEPYIRDIWNDLGPLLDVIFCNCDGYPVSTRHTFEEYRSWVRKAQAETTFFFGANAMTVDDLQYFTQLERIYRDGAAGFELRAAQETLKDPQQLSNEVMSQPANAVEVMKQGMLALSALYRLADLYTPEADGDILLRAAHALLKGLPIAQLPGPVAQRFAPQLDWFQQSLPAPLRPAPTDTVAFPKDEVQGGILNDLRDTHSCLLLLAIDDAAAAVRFLRELLPRITTEAKPETELHLNLAFTHQGLCQLGLPEAELNKFAVEFREGMEARAGLLGDVRCNHPRNWQLPERNWPGPDRTARRVEMSMVHVVIRLGVRGPTVEHPVQDPQHPLHAHIHTLAQSAQGLTLLAVEAATSRERGHFGYADGLSQPAVNQRAEGRVWANNIPLGDVLLGHPNRFDFPQPELLLNNGSYLVVRKLRQDSQFFHEQMERESLRLKIPTAVLKGKLMGRTPDGEVLASASPSKSNDFDYQHDADGKLCPFAAHVRRANPRIANTARIVRRGMSYGPRFDPAHPTDAARGLYFMAYNASIAEQFEVVQRWISGGNSTGIYSGEADPLLGVPQPGEPRTFRFQHKRGRQLEALHIKLNDESARPFVTLEWGLYLFVPSLTGLTTLIRLARRTQDTPNVAAGAAVVEQLLAQDQKPGGHTGDHWKAALEDAAARIGGMSANIWAAIRERHDGVLRTSYGVLVCKREQVLEVLADPKQRYSVAGYSKRMDVSLGKIYLGMDAGADYDREAHATNAAIQKISGAEGFECALRHTGAVLEKYIAGAKALAQQLGHRSWELTLDIKELSDAVLALICKDWFDVPDEQHIKSGGWHWNWGPLDAPLCPGHFTTPSRFIFQPNPGEVPERYARLHGQTLRAAMNAFVRQGRRTGVQGRISSAMFKAFSDPADDDLLARNLVGIMMGFLPPADGNLRATLYEWIEHRTLWEVQEAYLQSTAGSEYQRAMRTILQPLMNTMRLRPVPEMVWRTATERHRLGGVRIKPKDKIVLAIVSATQEDRLRGGASDVYPIFGGNRGEARERPHACPAYDSGMGVLLGILAGLCEAGPMRPTGAPLTLSFSGHL